MGKMQLDNFKLTLRISNWRIYMYICNIENVLTYAFTIMCMHSSWKLRISCVCTLPAKNHGKDCEMFVQCSVR